MKNNVNWTMIRAIARRDLTLYFTNPSGYVFVTLFIFLSAAAAFWQDRFFLNNLANLDQLNLFFPYLIALFVPALTMGVWADERKQGTDELLLTLPGTDLEIVLGKFSAALGVYTASLLLSLSHVIVLLFLGSPDIGLMIGNYIGYWLIGAAFIAAGMLASLFSPNATIAFILGTVLCSLFVFFDQVTGIFPDTVNNFFASLGVHGHFRDFSNGVISFSGLLYFLSLGSVMLFINILLIGRRHWPAEADGYKMWVHHLVRAVSVVLIVVSVNAILGRASSLRIDVTAERLHSLSGETKKQLDEIPGDRPVFIQAYISKEVPEAYVQTRENLIGFLEEMDALAGDKVTVMINDTEMYSEEAQEAREKFGILPRDLAEQSGTRTNVTSVFMGVAITSGAEEEVIPFFDRGLPTEYELLRSIRVVAKTQRKKIGIVRTEARLFGGLDYNTMQSTPAWQVVEELKKQYEVVRVTLDEPVSADLEGLVVALPSSLPQQKMNLLINYIEAGNPTVLLIDPLPIINPGLSPLERAGANMNPFMQQGPQPEEKGDIAGFIRRLGIQWNPSMITWNTYNPHPEMAPAPPEFVFLGAQNPNAESFNEKQAITSGLQELVLLYPGTISQPSDSPFEFTPLLQSGVSSGILSYYDIVQRNFLGMTSIRQGQPHYPTPESYTLAAHVSGNAPAATDSTLARSLNLVVIADLDFISSQFFEIRKMGLTNLNLDNVTFFLNSMDVLIGDDSFVDLRKRRVKHRTLTAVESQTQQYIERRIREEQIAEAEAQQELQQARQRLTEKVNEVRQRADLDERTKQVMAQNLQEAENKRFEAVRVKIETDKASKIAASKEEMESQIRSIQSGIRTLAVMLPPIPVLIIGIMIFIRRRRREQEGAAAVRRLRS